MRRSLAKLQGPEIGRLAGKAIGNIGKDHTAINCCRTWLEPEIEVFRLVKLLNILEILRVQPRDVHEDVVIHSDAVLVLMCRLAIFRERREPARL